MSVSSEHEDLVSLLIDWCTERFDIANSVLVHDSVSGIGTPKPPIIRGYRPDLTVSDIAGTYLAIGEAKTVTDLRTPHTRLQLTAFLEALKTQGNGVLVLSVPWGCEGAANSLLRLLGTDLGVNFTQWTVISTAPPGRKTR